MGLDDSASVGYARPFFRNLSVVDIPARPFQLFVCISIWTMETLFLDRGDPFGGQPFVLLPETGDEWSPLERWEIVQRKGAN